MIPHKDSWYVVQTHANAELKAWAHLDRQGYAVYLPRYLKRRRHARRVEIVPMPLFPRYLFVAVDIEQQRWRSIQSTVGVSRLLCIGDEPAQVASGIVEQLQSRHDDRGFITLDTRPHFAPGEKIRVVEGAFSTCLGLFQGMADHQRVSILLDLLGRKVRVVLEADAIAAA
jgi:transcriptional antiterminator RfaH